MAQIEVVAIDGPAASGKTTVGKLLAERLGFRFLDTGAMYRALTRGCMDAPFELNDASQVIAFCRAATLELVQGSTGDRVLLDGVDLTDQLHTPEVSSHVHYIADLPDVREVMVAKQRQVGQSGPTVAVGRDQCTVVFTDARYKFYLDASEAVRAKRRGMELEQQSQPVDPAEVARALNRRDRDDQNRPVGKLCIADDAEVIDTSELMIEQVVDQLARSVRGADC